MNHCLCHSKDTISSGSENNSTTVQNLKVLSNLSDYREGAKYPLLTCMNNDIEMTFLVDTGADVSIINKGSLLRLPHKDCGGMARIMTGSVEVTATNCLMNLKTEFFESEEEFRVLDIGSQCCTLSTMTGTLICGVLGMSFLLKHNAILDFSNNKIYIA